MQSLRLNGILEPFLWHFKISEISRFSRITDFKIDKIEIFVEIRFSSKYFRTLSNVLNFFSYPTQKKGKNFMPYPNPFRPGICYT